MEEITTAIVTALSTGAAFVAEKTAGEVVKDAYANLKGWIQNHYPAVSIEQLEKQPTSKSRQGVIGEDLESEGISRDEELVNLVRKVVELIRKEIPDTARSIGVDLGALEHATVTFGNVLAGNGATGVSVKKVTGGNLSFGDIAADSDANLPKKS